MKDLFKNWRILLLLGVLFLSIIAIAPSMQDGVAIRHVEKGSAADLAGIENPAKNTKPLGYEVITSINGVKISNLEEYHAQVSDLEINDTLTIRTTKSSYFMNVLPEIEIVVTNEIIEVTRNVTINGSVEEVTQEENRTIENIIGVAPIGMSVTDAPKNNIRKGLDLEGGVRVLLEPKEEVSNEVIEQVKQGLEQRLNVFGLSDVVIRTSNDLSGNPFILVEMAGTQPGQIRDILESQGHFEARIGNEVAFTGGEDVTYVCRSADCAGIDPQRGCFASSEGQTCSFFFTIQITPEAARRQADLTRELEVIQDQGGAYLSEPLELYLDDNLVSDLNIAASLRGRAETSIQISGSGSGSSRDSAVNNALQNMHQLQAILETGSLPVEMEIVKIDTLSPTLGIEFLRSAIIMAIVAIISVGAVIYLRYRKISIALPIMLTIIAEIIILLGVAALLGINIDLAAIAGIIIVVGTGVDHQIMITDEVLRRENTSTRQRIKNAFFTITAAFLTTLAAMLPLWFAGAGILKGFAATTIYGVAIGVLLTRPAYAAIIEYFHKE